MEPKPFSLPEDTRPEDMEVIEEEPVETPSSEEKKQDSPDFSEGKIDKKKSKEEDKAQIKLFDE